MKKNYQKEIGEKGEKLAKNYLEKNNYQIIETNYHSRHGEIDIICQKDEWYVFVEVKTRTNYSFGRPEESINDKKLENFKNTIEKYIIENNLNDKKWRVEVLAITLNNKKNKAKINHLKEI
ncbi:MAG: YraN family protein [Patescibacteria group bacterium]|nr:YraN family protein [Patescibacteria group bacterium]